MGPVGDRYPAGLSARTRPLAMRNGFVIGVFSVALREQPLADLLIV